MLRRTTAACRQLAYEYEIILADDGSRAQPRPNCWKTLPQKTGSNVVAVILNRNYGQHAAIMAGFDSARAKW